MTSRSCREREEQLRRLEERVIAAVRHDQAVPPKPYEEMTREEVLAWAATLESRHRDPAVEWIRDVAIDLLAGMAREGAMTEERLDGLLGEAGTHAGRCELVARFSCNDNDDVGSSWAELLDEGLCVLGDAREEIRGTMARVAAGDQMAPYELSLSTLDALVHPWLRCRSALGCRDCIRLLRLDAADSAASQAVARARKELSSVVFDVLSRLGGLALWVPDEYTGERDAAVKAMEKGTEHLSVDDYYGQLKAQVVGTEWMRELTDRFFGACVIELGCRLVPRRITLEGPAARKLAEVGFVPAREVLSQTVWQRKGAAGASGAGGTVAAGAFAELLYPAIAAYLKYDLARNGVEYEPFECFVPEEIRCWH